MEFQDALQKLIDSEHFKTWQKDHPEHYLIHGFQMLDPLNEHLWQIGYFDKKTEEVTTFVIDEDKVQQNPPSEIFKDPEKNVLELDPKSVTMQISQVLSTAEALQKDKYPQQFPMKIFFIIQHLDVGTVYNVTYITKTFSTLNMKIDASTGKVLQDNLVTIADFTKGEAGN